jgi:hypothetical protein
MASSTTDPGGGPRQNAHVFGKNSGSALRAFASVLPRTRLYALPAWGILVIRAGEKTVIAPTRRQDHDVLSHLARSRHARTRDAVHHAHFSADPATVCAPGTNASSARWRRSLRHRRNRRRARHARDACRRSTRTHPGAAPSSCTGHRRANGASAPQPHRHHTTRRSHPGGVAEDRTRDAQASSDIPRPSGRATTAAIATPDRTAV